MADVLKDRRGYIIDEIHYVDLEVILETGEIVGWDYCDVLAGAEHKGKYCGAFNRRVSPAWQQDATSVDGYNPAEEIYNADPFGNRAFYEQLFGEETVNGMTNTGETTRDVFPRVTFRDLQDAEMVVECLRQSTIHMGKKAAQAIKVWGTQKVLDAAGMPSTVMDGENKVADPHAVVKEITAAIIQMLEMMEAVISQLGMLYHGQGIPTQENAKYMTELLDFVTETREFVDAIIMTCDKYSETGE